MKKFLLAILSVLMLVCLGLAVACNPKDDGSNYYTLVFRQTNGVRYDCEVPSGWEVKEGTTVNFRLIISDEATGEPVVYANDEVLTANGNNSYSVVITENTTVRVGGIMAQGSDYNMLVFENTPGVSFNLTEKGLSSGMMVKYGHTVEFSLGINPQYQGKAVVYMNDTELDADVNGKYSFDMIAPTTIRVEGLIKHVDLVYSAGDTRVRYYTGDDNNKTYLLTDTPVDKIEGDVVEFKVQISVYYNRERNSDGSLPYEVLANQTILAPQSDGSYRVELRDDTTITVSGLTEDNSFVERRDGAGTARNPYRIRRAIDLYRMAMEINSGWWLGGEYYTDYYSLENDIDMEGEQLYIIGDGSTGISVFAGTFNGNGHTISNYTMNDLWIDQENFNSVFITNVGFFGQVVPDTSSMPAIYDLHLDDFTITADASIYPDDGEEYTLSVGALAGTAYGAEIIGCSATNGKILITAGDSGAYIGGLIGQQISAYAPTLNIQAYAGITSSYTDVDISIGIGTEYGVASAAGGIVGLLTVGEEHLTSYILNSYAMGDVDGALNSGGVVGYITGGASIINCYSTGDVTAYSHFEYNSAFTEIDYIYNAYAGGIVGRAGYNSVIYNSFSSGEVFASSQVDIEFGTSSHAFMSAVAAYVETGEELQDAHAYEAAIYGCPEEQITNITEQFIRSTMHWDEEDWLYVNGMPVINYGSTEKQFTIHFEAADNGEFGAGRDVNVSSRYWSMSMWYTDTSAQGIPEFMASTGNNNLRSYAYFFDAELTQRVFYPFIPTGNMTIYIGYADYSEVAGTYYFGAETTGERLEIETDGTYVYRKGGLYNASTYTWDGKTLVLFNSYLGELSNNFPEVEDAQDAADYKAYYLSSLYVFGATLAEDGNLSITGGNVQKVSYTQGVTGFLDDGTPIYGRVLGTTGGTFELFPVTAPLEGVRAIAGFEYGSYYYNGTVYQFYTNGTGVRTENNRDTDFDYTVSDKTITIKYSNSTVTGTIGDDGYVATIGSDTINPYDGFTGTWERSFNMNEVYTFDGKASNGNTGTWTYNGYDESVPKNGTYTIVDGKLNANNVFTAEVNENGFVEITRGSLTNEYYMGGSFEGAWYYAKLIGDSTVTINLTLNGISNAGYGTATAAYLTGEVYDLTYHAVPKGNSYTIYIYENEYLYAEMSYDSSTVALTGTLDGTAGRLTAYDVFRGLWISNNETLPVVQFNGNGFYDLAANNSGLAVRAYVFVNGNSSGSYHIDRTTMVGTYTYRNVVYTLKYNETLGVIEASYNGGNTFIFMQHDEWYGRQLEDENGVIYTFVDGRGNAGGGKLTASNGAEYTYYIEDDGSIRLEAKTSGYVGGTISIGEYDGHQVFMFKTVTNNSIPLTRHTAFTGEWIIGGESGTLSIGKIYADDKATGSYQFHGEDEVEVEFTYNFAGDYLSFNYTYTDDKGEEKTETFYVNALASVAATELSIGPDNSTSSVNNSICISLDRADSQYGKVYNIYDTEKGEDTGATLVFDGLSASIFGNGTAVVYDAEGSITDAYIYSITTEDGVESVQLIGEGYWAYYMVLQKGVPTRSLTEYEMFCVRDGDNYYIMVTPDALRDLTVVDADNKNVSYTFDGIGGVIRHNADGTSDKFTYLIILTDYVEFMHVLQFVAEDGTIYSVTLNQSSQIESDWTVKMSPADEYFGMAVADAASSEATFLFDGAGRVVRLSNIDSVVNYTYELVSVNGKIVTFTFIDNDSKVSYTAVLDMTSDNEQEWTITLTK